MAPDKIYIQPNAHDRWFEGNKPNDNFVEYVRKDALVPDNLDEAANSYASKTECAVVACRGFKAGAEWMAGQFLKIEGELVDWYSTSDGKDYCCGVKTIDAFEVPEGFYTRKKQ